jgi:TfoX/Sxy family transcriptional regulator of competence genes
MPYNEEFDSRVARVLPREAARKKMFGGTCYTIKGNMVCGVYKDFLILRLGERQAADALKLPGVKPMDITGKPMKGWVMIGAVSLTDEAVARWVEKAHAFAKSLPSK